MHWYLGALRKGNGRSAEQAFAEDYSFKISPFSIPSAYGQQAEIAGQTSDPLTLAGCAYLESSVPPTICAQGLVLVRRDSIE